MKKLPIIFVALALLAGGGWYYYTTTPDYLVASIKQTCAKNSFAETAKAGIAHINGETRELTSDEQTKMNEMFEKMPSEEECPFKDSALVKTKLAATDLARYGVEEGYKLAYEDEGKQRDIKILLFGGKWRYLLIEADFSTNTPAAVPGASAAPQMQVEINSPESQPAPNYTAPPSGYSY